MIRKTAALIAALALAPATALAQRAPRDQGDWPCRQIRVQHLSVESVWSGPVFDPARQDAARSDGVLSDLAPRVAARRTPIEAAEKLIADYAATGDRAQKKARLTALFAAVFDRLEAERSEVVAGLDRFGRTQKELAERLREKAAALREAQDAKPADPQKVKDLSDALAWDTRIFEDRRKSASYVCEAPALIEQRLGALARVIEQAIAD